jgi:hypothetical protein
MSVRIWSGGPCILSANSSASQTCLAVALATIRAQTQYLEWSSMPVTILTSVPSFRKSRPTTSICQSSIDLERSQRL